MGKWAVTQSCEVDLEDLEAYVLDSEVGEGPDKIVRRDSSGRLLGDGSLLTGIPHNVTYVHQQDSARAVWVIPHNKNALATRVDVVDSDGESRPFVKLENTDENISTVSFNSPIAGSATVYF
jgi:hypothetical protein